VVRSGAVDFGTVGDRFVLESPAGIGGMGVVYRARDRLTGLPVAVKTVIRNGTLAADRFLREVSVLSELDHPAIVRYVAHGVIPPDWTYLAMEWLEGIDLGQRLREGERLTADEVLVLIRRIAEALGVAHARGVVHRDIKPANIFLVDGKLEQAKLLDFGVALQDVATRRLTETGAVVGTPCYMAPEQAAGERAVGPQADLFSLGCVWFECLTGSPPFVARTPVLADLLFDHRPSLRELRPDVRPELDDLIGSLLAVQPERRPRDAAALLEAIAALPDAAMASTPDQGPPRPMRLTTREERLGCLIAAGRPPRAREEDPTLDVLSGDEERLRALVSPYGGKLGTIRDGVVLITLGGAGPPTDQATLAARCALAIREEVPELSLALVTGRAGALRDSGGRMPFERVLAMLAAVPSAGASGHAGVIAVDEVTADLLEARFDVAESGGVRILRRERESGPLPGEMRTLLGKPTPCLGRESELATLDAIYAHCASEPLARAVLVTAPAGVGKSRLRCELVKRIRDRGGGALILTACGDPMSSGSLFGMVNQILRQASGINAGDAPPLRSEKLRARLARRLHGAALESAEELLGEMVGAAVPASVRGDPRALGEKLRAAWESWLQAEAREQPVVIVLDDLHWGDLPSVKFIDSALRRLADHPLLVIAFARPEVHARFSELWAERNVHELRLAGLSRKASERLVRIVLGETAGEGVRARIASQAEGNAFYLEELIRAVAAGRTAALPEAVLGMVEARLDALAPAARRVLRAGSVFGEVFWSGGVAALLGGDAEKTDADAWLSLLVDQELLDRGAPSRYSGEHEYSFRHGLVREAAYATLTDADRTSGHRLAAGWLLASGEREPLVIAEHLERGRDDEAAVPWLLEAALAAWKGGDLRSAIALAERGVECGARGEVRGHLLAIQSEAYHWIGNPTECIARGMDAMSLVPASDPRARGVPYAVMLYAPAMGDVDATAVALERLRAQSLPDQMPGDLARAIWGATAPLYIAGQRAFADDLFRRLERHRAAVDQLDPEAAGWIHQAFCVKGYFATGDLWLMLTEARAAFECFARARDRMGCMPARFGCGIALCELGAYDEAEPALRDVLAMAGPESGEFVIWESYARIVLGVVHRRRGELDRAERLLLACADEMARTRDALKEGWSRTELALVHAERGELDEAHRHAARATSVLAHIPYFGLHAMAARAHILTRLGRAGEALELAERATTVGEELGVMAPAASLLRLAYAEALGAGGDARRGRAALDDAREQLRARAGRIPVPRYRELFLNAIPENRRTLALAEEL
jgi:tetratricopeptide (TPR) repeat protein